MCTDKNNDKNKTNFPPPSSHPIKPITMTMTLEFSDFKFVFIKCFLKNKM